jgi:GDP-4-dehydro-6-deoxy-D-mannose reductase
MRTLVIGAAGFAGKYLLAELALNKAVELHATKLENERITHPAVHVHDLDVRDGEAVHRLIRQIAPDFVCHLAALSSVKQSWEQPELTVDINFKGALHLLEAIRVLPEKPRVLLIGSGEEYGFSALTHDSIAEDALPQPGNI